LKNTSPATACFISRGIRQQINPRKSASICG
jgi:hypothetical protein